MKKQAKSTRLSWKMKIALMVSVLWVLFWSAAGWAEEEIVGGVLFAVFPNLVCWGFWVISRSSHKDEDAAFAAHLHDIKKSHDPESRKFVRLEYPRIKRPSLILGAHHFQVVNISERGIKIRNDQQVRLDRFVQGEVSLLCGKRIRVEGEVSWSLDQEMGLLIFSIPASDIEEEKRCLTKLYPNAMKLQ